MLANLTNEMIKGKQMVFDEALILKAVTIAKIKGAIATYVWEMQLSNFNVEILDVITEDIYNTLDKIKDPTDLNNAPWQAALEAEIERYISKDCAPALSIIPWFDKLTGADNQIIANMAVGGVRHNLLHVITATTLIKNKILKGATLAKIATPGNLQGSLEWFIIAKEIAKEAPDEKIIEKFRVALAYEIEVINR